jgi:hypothetical protein
VYVPGGSGIENVPSGLLSDVVDVVPEIVICALPRGFPAPSVTVPVMLPTVWASTRTGVTIVDVSAIASNADMKKHRSFKGSFFSGSRVRDGKTIDFPVDDPSFFGNAG